MIEIEQLTFAYDHEKTILNKVSFTLETGSIYCLLGINGAGKTTLFNCLSGFLKSNLNVHQTIFKDKLLYIQDNMHFYQDLTGIEFTRLIFSLKNKSFDNAQFDHLLNRLKMAEFKEERISIYSLGTKQKLVLIIGMLLDYEYILMDEPFAAIDFITSEVVTDVLQEIKSTGKTIVISTHQLDIAQELADEILFLNNGEIQQLKNEFKTPNELKNHLRTNL